jgi:FG-GAP-like repeat
MALPVDWDWYVDGAPSHRLVAHGLVDTESGLVTVHTSSWSHSWGGFHARQQLVIADRFGLTVAMTPDIACGAGAYTENAPNDFTWHFRFNPDDSKRAATATLFVWWSPDWSTGLVRLGELIDWIIDRISRIGGSGNRGPMDSVRPPAGGPYNYAAASLRGREIPIGEQGLMEGAVLRGQDVPALPNEDWTQGPYYGQRGTVFADLTGNGRADAIVVNDDTVTVRRNTGNGFGPNEDWTQGPYFGQRGTFFADLTGDGRADAIVVNDDTITVRRNAGNGFGPNEDWTHGPFYGAVGTFFADLTGDGRADAIVVNGDTVTVRRNTGADFGADPGANEDWTHGPFFGQLGTFFTDVSGDGRADAIVVNPDTITVRRNTGGDFGADAGANEDWTHGPYNGARGTYFADLTGDQRADAIVVNDDTVTVRLNAGGDFGPDSSSNQDWTGGPYYGSRGTHFTDVTGDAKADAIVVNEDTVTVRRTR